MLQRHRLAVYYVLSLFIAMAVMTVSMLRPHPVDVISGLRAFQQHERLTTSAVSIIRYALAEQPLAWLILVFAGAPTIAAIVVSAALGDGGLSRLLARYRPWHRSGEWPRALRCYALLLSVSGVVMAWYYWTGTRHGTAQQLSFRNDAIGTAPIAIGLWLLLRHFTDEGGTFEELGWRGFALPALLERFGSPLKASVVLGSLWMAWHLPREIPGLLSGAALVPFLHEQLIFLALTIGLSVLCTWGFLETGGSVVPAVIIHGGSNVWSKALAEPLYPSLSWPVDPRTIIIVALAALLVAVRWRQMTMDPRAAGRQAGSRRLLTG